MSREYQKLEAHDDYDLLRVSETIVQIYLNNHVIVPYR